MKKFFIALGLVMTMSSSLMAQTVSIGEVKTEIETKNISGRTFVKLREVSEILGCEISYDSTQKTITVSKQDAGDNLKNVQLTYTIGDRDYAYSYMESFDDAYARRGGNPMDTTPQVIDGSTYLPIRYVAEPLGYKISVNENKEIVLEKELRK